MVHGVSVWCDRRLRLRQISHAFSFFLLTPVMLSTVFWYFALLGYFALQKYINTKVALHRYFCVFRLLSTITFVYLGCSTQEFW